MFKIMHPFLVIMCMFLQSYSQVKTGTKKGDLESNLYVLNLFGEKPQGIQEFYRTAYTILAADPKADFMDVAMDSDIRRICRENDITHLGGPMLGGVTSSGARVWVRTLGPAEVRVIVIDDGKEKTFGPVQSTKHSDLTAVVPVTGLEPGSRYPYRVLVNGTTIDIPEHSAIVTAPEPLTTGKVRIAFGSCFHRWGLGNTQQADLIRSRRPAAMLLIGDIAVQDRNNHIGLHRADYLMRDLFPGWQDLVATVPVYATWDDHDYFDNDLWGIPPGYTLEDKQAVLNVFKQAWNNPSYGFGDERGGLFQRTRIGPCDIIMVDNRYFRTGEKGVFLGEGQMQWLKEQLLDCKGPFIILSCGTMWSDYVSNGKDSWGRYDPEGRKELFQLIQDNRIGGVLLISGDRHGARGFRIPQPSGFEFYEFEAASLGGRQGPSVTRPEWTTQLYGFENTYAFGEFTIDATLKDPRVTMRLIRDDGQVIYEKTLLRSELTPQ